MKLRGRNRHLIAGFALAAAVALAPGVNAAPIMYDEGVSGDLSPGATFNLDVGDNVWTGTIVTPNDDGDIWEAVLAAGHSITSIRWQFNDPSGDYGTELTFDMYDPGSGNILDHRAPNGTVEDITDSGFSILNPTLPQASAGGYDIDIIPGTIDPAATWTVTLTVAGATQLPAPGALALFVLGLAGLGALRRHKGHPKAG